MFFGGATKQHLFCNTCICLFCWAFCPSKPIWKKEKNKKKTVDPQGTFKPCPCLCWRLFWRNSSGSFFKRKVLTSSFTMFYGKTLQNKATLWAKKNISTTETVDHLTKCLFCLAFHRVRSLTLGLDRLDKSRPFGKVVAWWVQDAGVLSELVSYGWLNALKFQEQKLKLRHPMLNKKKVLWKTWYI